MLLQAIIREKENNFSGGFKLKAHNNLPPKLCCESVAKILWT